MPNIAPHPDFSRFLDTLLLRKFYLRPPIFDFHVAESHKSRLLGRPCVTPADDVEFWRLAGYDYVHCPLFIPQVEREAHTRALQGNAASHSSEIGIIESAEHFHSQRWSWQDVADGDLTLAQDRLDWMADAAKHLPDGMKICLHCADIFTYAWEMLGFTNLCLASLEQPEFVQMVMDSLARAMMNIAQAGVEIVGDKLGMMFYSDDIAYTEGLMLGPDFFAQTLFPWIEQFAKIGQPFNAPLVYHTDGRLYDVFDNLARIGVNGIQPLEPKSMDPLVIKQRWPKKFCLMGNIDLDLLSRGTLQQVEAHVHERLDRLHFGKDPASPYPGGYMPGVSNTVPYYVQYENYCRMLEIVHHLDPEGRCEL